MRKGIEHFLFKQVSPWGQQSFLEKLNRFCLLAHIKRLSFKGDTGKLEFIQRRDWITPAYEKQLKEVELVKTRLRGHDYYLQRS